MKPFHVSGNVSLRKIDSVLKLNPRAMEFVYLNSKYLLRESKNDIWKGFAKVTRGLLHESESPSSCMAVTSTINPTQIGNVLFVTLVTIAFSATLSFMSDIVIFDEEPYSILKDLKLKNVNRIICAQLNINSIR